jgi:ABC-type polysaccharide transport system permease subunit
LGLLLKIAFENQQITDSVPHSEWGLRNFNQCIDRTEFITIYKQRLSEIIADKKRSLQ